MIDETTVPQCISVEQNLLGALLLENRLVHELADLQATNFFEPVHQQLYELIASEVHAGKAANPVTLQPVTANWSPILNDTFTVPQYLVRLSNEAVSTRAAAVRDYARIVIEYHNRRQAIVAVERLLTDVCDPEADLEETLRRCGLELDELTTSKNRPDAELAIDVIDRVLADAQRARHDGQTGSGLPYPALQRMIGPLQAGNVYVVAGRPSMGKTAFLTDIVCHAGVQLGVPSGVFSMEMTSDDIAARLLSRGSGIPTMAMRTGQTSDGDFKRLFEARKAFIDRPIFIDDQGGLSVDQLVARARRMKRRHGIQLLAVDYVQLLKGRGENRTQELTNITSTLKTLAKELGVPVILLAQLSRKVEERSPPRPQLADLRESSSIEQDADAVMFLYREEYYKEREEPDTSDTAAHGRWQREMSEVAGRAQVIVAKYRHGEVGTIRLHFDGKGTTFTDVDERYTPDDRPQPSPKVVFSLQDGGRP